VVMMEILLSDLRNGDEGKVKKLDGGLEFQNKLSSMGIIVGKKIKKITSQPFGGPIVIKVNNTEVSIGRGMANRIFLEV